MPEYDHKLIEARWQNHWEVNDTFRVYDHGAFPKKYILDMFLYPSAQGLHVGHPLGYTATDILCRYWSMTGFNVLHPMGWDAFGLPAEQHAIKTGEHPRTSTDRNIANFKRQLKSLGFSYDWNREINTCDPDYYKWTQWMFLLIWDTWYDHEAKKGRPIADLPIPAYVETRGPVAVRDYINVRRLAYMTDMPVNWCEELGTVLANEEVIDGKSVDGGHPVCKRSIQQWMLRITDYAERLDKELEIVDWPEHIIKMQREWIGLTDYAVPGHKTWTTRLHDWVFSRQRYWGEPIPILHGYDSSGRRTGEIIAEHELPVILPDLSDFKPTGNAEPVLEKAEDWKWVHRNGKLYKRETNTMPQWAGSCWYYLRYIDPFNYRHFCEPNKQVNWLPVNIYVGGSEHAVLHLLYARFWHKVLFDRGHVHCSEPFTKLVNQGIMLGKTEFTAFQKNGMWIDLRNIDGTCDEVIISDDKVIKKGQAWVLKENESVQCNIRTHKMAKSRGNVVSVDDIVEEHGADTFRLYEMFLGPLESSKSWDVKGIVGCARFIRKVWHIIIDVEATDLKLNPNVKKIIPDETTKIHLHRTIHRIRTLIEEMRFNVAISTLMEFSNFLAKQKEVPHSVAEQFVLMLSPFAPHIAEELWKALGHTYVVAGNNFPKYNPTLLVKNEHEITVQLNGKFVTTLHLPPPLDGNILRDKALEAVDIVVLKEAINRVIIVPGRLVNIITKAQEKSWTTTL